MIKRQLVKKNIFTYMRILGIKIIKNQGQPRTFQDISQIPGFSTIFQDRVHLVVVRIQQQFSPRKLSLKSLVRNNFWIIYYTRKKFGSSGERNQQDDASMFQYDTEVLCQNLTCKIKGPYPNFASNVKRIYANKLLFPLKSSKNQRFSDDFRCGGGGGGGGGGGVGVRS